MTVTGVEIREYVERGYGRCIRCKAEEISGGPVEIDCNLAVQEVTCQNCGYAWEDVYTLSGIRIIETTATVTTHDLKSAMANTIIDKGEGKR